VARRRERHRLDLRLTCARAERYRWVVPDAGVDESLEERLRRIQAVTDTALSHLDVEDFLTELLDRVLEILGADTAAVLLADESGKELFARATRGLEEEVRQGVRIPIGRGFAGTVAAQRRPVVLDRVDETTVANPILWQKGIRAMLGVPLVSGGSVIGVLHVGTLGDRRFADDDVELLQLAADRIAGALHVRLLEAERDAAEALQRSLLPSALPRLAGLEFAARYVPAQRGGIGGDWYDVFQLDSGDVWIVTGDVAGHGLRAAVVMGRVRSALRAYALLGRAPEDVLALTDRKMQHFEVGQMATIAVAVVSPPYDEARISLAGHPPPVIAAPGRETFITDVEPGPPLGFGLSPQRPPKRFQLPPGAMLFFYTDGLIERRGESLVDGVERLRDALTADAPHVVCQRVMGALVGQWEPEDDIAVLAVRRSGEPGN
jgi:putative methionine-R-sulfoxide reductase with GAF domain